jgi:hypothetical protein
MTRYIGFSNDDLGKIQIVVHAGDTFLCQKCGKLHELLGGTVNGEPSELLLFYTCEDSMRLGAVDNKLVIDIKPTTSGEVDLDDDD